MFGLDAWDATSSKSRSTTRRRRRGPRRRRRRRPQPGLAPWARRWFFASTASAARATRCLSQEEKGRQEGGEGRLQVPDPPLQEGRRRPPVQGRQEGRQEDAKVNSERTPRPASSRRRRPDRPRDAPVLANFFTVVPTALRRCTLSDVGPRVSVRSRGRPTPRRPPHPQSPPALRRHSGLARVALSSHRDPL